MSENLLRDLATEMFGELCTPAALEAAESDGWSAPMWSAVADAGLPWISVPESAGGEGGTLHDAMIVLRAAGSFGLPLPLAETGVLAGWLVAGAGLQVERTPAAVARSEHLRWDGTRVTGLARNVAWGSAASRLITLVDSAVLVFDPTQLRIEPFTGLAGEPSDTVHFDGVEPLAAARAGDGVDSAALALRGMLTRVVLMSGSLSRALAMTVRYTAERQQFGKPVARFQAVQQHLVHLAQQVALLDMAAAQATAAMAASATDAHRRFAVLAAKSVADDASRIATRAAHQAHGAMGMTREYPLHHTTRRLWAWTRQWGTGAESALALGQGIVTAGVDSLWLELTAQLS